MAASLLVPLTTSFEGKENSPYRDVGHVLTVCYGNTVGIQDRHYSDAECENMLMEQERVHAERVLRIAPYLKAHPYALAAAVDFDYNTGRFAGSSMDRAFRHGDYATGCERFEFRPDGKRQWVYAAGRELPGLVRRAEARRKLCEKGL